MGCDFWLGRVSGGNDLPNKGGISVQYGACLSAILRQQKTQGDGNCEQYERCEREYTFLYGPEPPTIQGVGGTRAASMTVQGEDGSSTIQGGDKRRRVNPRPYPIRFYHRCFLDRVEGDAYRGEGLHG